MTKQEFIAQVQAVTNDATSTISTEDYKVVEYVYTWHPAIVDVGGKRQIAEIYARGGMLVIRDMLSRAKKAEEYDRKIRAIRKDIAGMEKQVNDLMAEILA